MRLELVEAIMDSYRRLETAVDRLARSKLEATMAEKDFKVFKQYGSLDAFYVEDDGQITAYYTYTHPYEGDETVTLDPVDIAMF